MKVRIGISREVEIDINTHSAIAMLDKYYRQHPNDPDPSFLIKEAISDIEEFTGIPFGNDDAPETIYGVYAEDGEAILEW